MRHAPRRRGQEGLLFVEMMITGALFALIAVTIMQFLTNQSDAVQTSMYQSDLRSDVQQAIRTMTGELQMARRTAAETPPSVNVPAAPGNTTMTLFLPTDVDGTNGILDALGNVEWNTLNPIQYVYDAAAQQLTRVEGAATRVLANDVTSATFDDQQTDATLLATEVRIQLTVQRVTPFGRTVSASANTVVRLRN